MVRNSKRSGANFSATSLAKQLLETDLLPWKAEIELEMLTTLFGRNTPGAVDFTYDTDVATKLNSIVHTRSKRSRTPAEELMKAILAIRAGAVSVDAMQSIAMNGSSMVAATQALKRAGNAGKLGKGGKDMLKRATQRTAGVLAMRASASAAINGSIDGILGADPLVVDTICLKMKSIFENHGAVRLSCPLLRPRPNFSENLLDECNPAELMNSRGTVVVLPEDLVGPFGKCTVLSNPVQLLTYCMFWIAARALGRGGSAASYLKRYNIDKTYHQALAEGHPRETLEAAFDIVYEDTSKIALIEAETLIVAMEVIGETPSPRGAGKSKNEWFLRLGHTRLADALLDLCGVPMKEPIRSACLRVLTKFSAPSPSTFVFYKRSGATGKSERRSRRKLMAAELQDLVVEHGLPLPASQRLSTFIESCFPLPMNAASAISTLQGALVMLKNSGLPKETRKTKRVEDAARSLKGLRDLIDVLGVSGFDSTNNASSSVAPVFISVDLGLRYRPRNYHGGTVFQCILLPDDLQDSKYAAHEDNEAFVMNRGRILAEGGNFSELVRKNRPPGNFASSLVSQYTSARIPVCCGVKFQVGTIVELAYRNAALATEEAPQDFVQKGTVDKLGISALRDLLAHPMSLATTVQVLVASVHGMDAESTKDRFLVASRLWADGISAEYITQSGVALSLTRRFSTSSDSDSDWSLLELQGVCALLRIPFLVIVQPHQLRDKRVVRLRKITFDSTSVTNNGFEDTQVTLDALASTIRDNSSHNDANASVAQDSEFHSTSFRDRVVKPVEVIYVEHDNYISSTKEVSKKDARWKPLLKAMKGVKLSAEAFMSHLNEIDSDSVPSTGLPVFAAAELSFFMLRDFGTALMRRDAHDQSALKASEEMTEKYPRHKRIFKTLAAAIDSFMQRNDFWGDRSNTADTTPTLLTALLYSKRDDRFDMISLSIFPSNKNKHGFPKRVRSR